MLIIISDIHYVGLSDLLMRINYPRLKQNVPPALPAGSYHGNLCLLVCLPADIVHIIHCIGANPDQVR